jgi:hypothetical protein
MNENDQSVFSRDGNETNLVQATMAWRAISSPFPQIEQRKSTSSVLLQFILLAGNCVNGHSPAECEDFRWNFGFPNRVPDWALAIRGRIFLDEKGSCPGSIHIERNHRVYNQKRTSLAENENEKSAAEWSTVLVFQVKSRAICTSNSKSPVFIQVPSHAVLHIILR